jgi:hypothetical protein
VATGRGWRPGPALLALPTGAAPVPRDRFEPRNARERPGGYRRRAFSSRSPCPSEGTTRDRATAMTQACATRLEGPSAAHEDWHMMQRVFIDDLDPALGRAQVPMRIGIVCPYSFDIPGGVQYHVRDLAETSSPARARDLGPGTRGRGHTDLPDYVVSAGRAVPVRYNGSVARLNFGPMTNAGSTAGSTGVASTSSTSTNPSPPRRLAGAVGRRVPDRRDLPHLEPALPRDAGVLPVLAAQRWRRSSAGSPCPRTPAAP